MSYKVLVTDEIDEIAIKILQDVFKVHYRPVLNATDIKTIMRDHDALMIRSASRVTKDPIAVADPIKKRTIRTHCSIHETKEKDKLRQLIKLLKRLKIRTLICRGAVWTDSFSKVLSKKEIVYENC